METNEKTLLQRLNAVMLQVDSVLKEDKKVNNQYRFVSHDAVTKLLHRPLAENGIHMVPSVVELTQEGNRTTAKVMLQFFNIDNVEDCCTIFAYGYGIDPQDKGPGKAVSYAVKTGLLKMFMLEAGEEDIEVDVKTDFNPEAKVGSTEMKTKKETKKAGNDKSFLAQTW